MPQAHATGIHENKSRPVCSQRCKETGISARTMGKDTVSQTSTVTLTTCHHIKAIISTLPDLLETSKIGNLRPRHRRTAAAALFLPSPPFRSLPAFTARRQNSTYASLIAVGYPTCAARLHRFLSQHIDLHVSLHKRAAWEKRKYNLIQLADIVSGCNFIFSGYPCSYIPA